MTVTEIVNEIIAQDCVEEVSKMLLDVLIQQKIETEKNYAEARASLRAIHNINAGAKQSAEKTEAISALSEV